MLSLVVIAKNEADRVARCLGSVPFADERIVVESGSSDATVEVARAAGARVVRTDWPGHVAQKNRALSLAKSSWVLSLDADEWLSPEAAASVRLAVREPAGAVGFRFARRSRWLGHELRHGRWYPDRKLRLVLRDRASFVGLGPHDRVAVSGRVRDLPGDILHEPYRDLSEHLATIGRYSINQAAALHAAGHRARWLDLAGRPVMHFVDAYLLRRGFLDGMPGLTVAGLGATHTLCKWAALHLEERRAHRPGHA